MSLYEYYISLPDELIDEILSYGDIESHLKMNSVIIQINYYSKEFDYHRNRNRFSPFYQCPKTKYPQFAFRQIENKKDLDSCLHRFKTTKL